MAEKMVFLATPNGIKKEIVTYVFVPGFAEVQKKKNVVNLHNSIKYRFRNKKVLEVSTKSDEELGQLLSAFNLKLDGYYVESIFQSSKVFEDGSKYDELLDKTPRQAKKFIKNLPPKKVVGFRYKGIDYPTFPTNAFYDYIYINAVLENKELVEKLKDYDIFTDIEFNYTKQLNCQAKTCAMLSTLLKNGEFNKHKFDIQDVIELNRKYR